MAIVTQEELLKQANEVIGENPTDAALALLENIADTVGNNSASAESAKKIEELENKVKTVEAEWRKKYRDRFLDYTPDTDVGAKKSEEDNGANDDDIEPPSFEELAAEF